MSAGWDERENNWQVSGSATGFALGLASERLETMTAKTPVLA